MRPPALRGGASVLFLIMFLAPPVGAWSNGGYSADPADPDYGTHDWIAEHALDWLPSAEKAYLTGNRAADLYGTELPDNGGAPDGIGDTSKHHVYYRAGGVLQDDASAVRASQEYASALGYLRASNLPAAAKAAGILSHYVVDVAVFGHVMGASTDWGAEVHHGDYEDYVTARMTAYASTTFDPYLVFDGALETVTAYYATLDIADNTTFGDGGATKGCAWMDANYDWENPAFQGSAGASLNRAVNALADVLHTLAAEAQAPGPAPDLVAPTVTITSPAEDAVLVPGSITVTGSAWDNVAVERVQVSTDGVSWADGGGMTSWSATLAVGPGTTRICARATDTAGNSNTTWVRVTVDGAGTHPNPPDPLPAALVATAAVLAVVFAGVGLWWRRRRRV